MKNLIAFFITIVFVTVGSGCSKDENPTNTDNNQSTLPVGTLKAKVNGKEWSASIVQTQKPTSNALMINAVNAVGQSNIGLTLREFGDAMEYTHTGGIGNTLDGVYGLKEQGYFIAGGSKVRVTKKTSTNIQGTFNLVVTDFLDTGLDTIRITDGQFNLDY